jgi:hypothetical protein
VHAVLVECMTVALTARTSLSQTPRATSVYAGVTLGMLGCCTRSMDL